jgi:F-type H+-transporting ATPase subunit alpha
LFNKGVRPGVNVGISVSRVGSAAQTKAMKKVAGKLRLELAQFRELEAFAQFSQDLDADTKKRIEKGRLMVEVLKQDKHVPIPFERQVIIMYVALQGLIETLKPGKVQEFEREFIGFLDRQQKDVLEAIRTSRDLSKESEEGIKSAVTTFKKDFPGLFQ